MIFPSVGYVISNIRNGAFGDYGNCPSTMKEVSSVLRDQCLHKQACSPDFNIGLNGQDPCPNHVKWMDAGWDCALLNQGVLIRLSKEYRTCRCAGLLPAAGAMVELCQQSSCCLSNYAMFRWQSRVTMFPLTYGFCRISPIPVLLLGL